MKTFNDLKQAVSQQFDKMAKGTLFITDTQKDTIWDLYLDSFPEGTNPIYKERREYDCNCCKQFIRAVGNVVGTIDGELQSIWDCQVGGHFQPVVDALAEYVKTQPVKSVFFHDSRSVGVDSNVQLVEGGETLVWNHFHQILPKKVVVTDGSITSKQGKSATNYATLKRSVEEITPESIDVVLELIEQDSLYRGVEHKATLQKLQKVQRDYAKTTNKEAYLWETSIKLGAGSAFRNTVIGTLLTDISEGVELDQAVKSFESKVAPSNYKRSKSIVTEGMIKKAQQKVQELGIEDALYRRFAVTKDLTINNVLFADRTAKESMGAFEGLLKSTPTKPLKFDHVEEIAIKDFIEKVLPKTESIEMMVENSHTSNLVSLLAPTHEHAEPILKWGNNFSWSYKGEVADSMKEQVRAKGGNVGGAFRFTHSWNHTDENQSLMDLHVFLPANNASVGWQGETHNTYGNAERVGWNKRKHPSTQGTQDVDYTAQAPNGYIPIENISFPDKNLMPEGEYVLKVHNWSYRGCGKGFKAEVEFDGQIYQYEYTGELKHHEWVTVAVVTLKKGKFSIEHKLDSSAQTKEVWGVTTQKFHKVDMVLNSPNHWDGECTGNKHYFFMLEGCINPDKARGFYNEFLRDDLMEHRKVFEVLGNKLKAEKAEKADVQLSGLGFSSTQRNEVVVKVKGATQRMLKIKF